MRKRLVRIGQASYNFRGIAARLESNRRFRTQEWEIAAVLWELSRGAAAVKQVLKPREYLRSGQCHGNSEVTRHARRDKPPTFENRLYSH